LDQQSVAPTPKKKPKTRTIKEATGTPKAQSLTEHKQQAAAKGARPRTGDKCDPLEAFVPKLGKDAKRLPLTKKAKADEAKFAGQMAEWHELVDLLGSKEAAKKYLQLL
jgi:hypothetical protein